MLLIKYVHVTLVAHIGSCDSTDCEECKLNDCVFHMDQEALPTSESDSVEDTILIAVLPESFGEEA